MLTLRALELGDMETIRQERNNLPPGILRTPYLLTKEMQEEWYYQEIANRDSTTRYWGLEATEVIPGLSRPEIETVRLVGYGGIENIQWENGMGEMSLMVFSKDQGKGYGREAVRLFLEQAFWEMGLDTVYAEVYQCNPNAGFWPKHGHHNHTVFPRRKRCRGDLYYSDIYIWEKDLWVKENT